MRGFIKSTSLVTCATALCFMSGPVAAEPNPLKIVYFGEQHIHTANWPDSFAVVTLGTWYEVYNYAMGNPI